MKARLARNPRTTRALAAVAGASPLLLGFALYLVVAGSEAYRYTGWASYLAEHRDKIFQTLIVSLLMVAVVSALFNNKIAVFLAGFQPGAHTDHAHIRQRQR